VEKPAVSLTYAISNRCSWLFVNSNQQGRLQA